MKAQRPIVKALLLLLILLLSSIGMRAFGSGISVPSCRVATHVSKRHEHNQPGNSRRVMLRTGSHHSPAQRTHRLRGKKINIDTAFSVASRTSSITTLSMSKAKALIQEPGGPNPPRGPPLLSL